MRKNTLLKVVTIVLAAMIAVISVPANVWAMDGDAFENVQEDRSEEEYQEDTNEETAEETTEETYSEAVEEAAEAEDAAEEAVDTAEEACEAVESIVDGNEEAGFEAASAEDGGAVAQESVETFVEAVENSNVAETVNEAAVDLQAAKRELVVASEADKEADVKAVETVANVVAAQYIADSAAETVAEAKVEAEDLIETITNADADAEQVSEAFDKLDKLTDDTKEEVEIKRVAFEALCDKFEQAKRELSGAQRVYDETVKALKSDDSNVKKAAEKLEEAKKNVETLSEACDNAKEALEKEQAAVKDINKKKEISDVNKDWKTQDKLMESIISGYIIPNMVDKDATNFTYTDMLRGFDRQNSSYCRVTYTDKDGNTVVRYFNIDRTDRQFKANDQWYKLGSSREIVIYEKPLEDITSSEYQKQHFGNKSVTSQFKADVNSGKYDVYSFDYADGTNEFKCIDEIQEAVKNKEMTVVDGVYYLNGVAGRKIVQTTSGNAKGIRVSTKDDEGLQEFIANASKLVEKYEKYGETIADTQDKIDEAADKVEALEDAIEAIDENEDRIAKVVTKDFVAGLRTYIDEQDIDRIVNAESIEEAIKILDEILAGAKKDFDIATAKLDELVEKRDEIGRQLEEKTGVSYAEEVTEEVIVAEVEAQTETLAASDDAKTEENDAAQAVAVNAVAAVSPNAMITEVAANRQVTEENGQVVTAPQGAVLGARVNKTTEAGAKEIQAITPAEYEMILSQILGAKRNAMTDRTEKFEANNASVVDIEVEEDAEPVAKLPVISGMGDWMWIILAFFGMLGKISPLFF
ncbi:hypothetical protein D6856_13060 [Butyrivibrio sp. XB500-5]|uniref:hypothetical protein n=2 Tax=unclassified Butyrivibrio TaxID=2639466 RepID=UPI000EAAAE91|nr:hypothetical protein [Butyrivibrio sp. XB500-5]RKM58673.1 hypothetical protein D6856_13060 [Butyrivibrio sp. XB500-5]